MKYLVLHTKCLILHHLRRAPGGDLIDRVLEAFFHVIELVADIDMLGAVLLALAAFDAQARVTRRLAEGGAHEVLPQAVDKAVHIAGIINGETGGDVHALGAGLAIAAAGAAHAGDAADGLDGAPIHGQLLP